MVLPSEATIEIWDPDKPGDYLVISARSFDPAKHRRRSDPPYVAPVERRETIADSDGGEDEEPETPDRPRRGRPPRVRE